MRCSVIVSTYESPRLLERVLGGYSVQSCRDFELLVADDGSGPETRQVVESAAARHGLRIEHLWHPDDGFRKCAILNRAIERARADYLIFSDGDCIPAPDFVATHLALATPGTFLSGGCVRLPSDASARIGLDDVLAGRATDYEFLLGVGLHPSRQTWLKLASPTAVGSLADYLTPTRRTWNGHNSSCWRESALRVNGFDERMGYGGEDREFGERLLRAGVKGIQVRYRARCVHLYHERGYVCPDVWRKNDAIRAENRRSRAIMAATGISRSPQSGGAGARAQGMQPMD